MGALQKRGRLLEVMKSPFFSSEENYLFEINT